MSTTTINTPKIVDFKYPIRSRPPPPKYIINIIIPKINNKHEDYLHVKLPDNSSLKKHIISAIELDFPFTEGYDFHEFVVNDHLVPDSYYLGKEGSIGKKIYNTSFLGYSISKHLEAQDVNANKKDYHIVKVDEKEVNGSKVLTYKIEIRLENEEEQLMKELDNSISWLSEDLHIDDENITMGDIEEF